jgi:hypothetical protein
MIGTEEVKVPEVQTASPVVTLARPLEPLTDRSFTDPADCASFLTTRLGREWPPSLHRMPVEFAARILVVAIDILLDQLGAWRGRSAGSPTR